MKKVLVAMSGGVDSSVAAALLQKQGYFAVGGYMKNFSAESWEGVLQADCPWEKDLEDIKAVCDKLGIEFRSFNFEKEYAEKVIEYFFDEYAAGRTPNPDVMCNKEIKFGVFLEKAVELGFDYIATGHYARIKTSPFSPPYEGGVGEVKYELLKGIDPKKDQSYFLYTLTQDQLSHTLFPIGNYTKTQIRKLAKEFDLPNWDKKDSQGVCFVGHIKLREFLRTRIPEKVGEIVEAENRRVIGQHRGAWYYTVGQREGIGIGGGVPYYVAQKDIINNRLVVTVTQGSPSTSTGTDYLLSERQRVEGLLYSKKAYTRDVYWIGEPPMLPFPCKAKIRYQQADQTCTLFPSPRLGRVAAGQERSLVVQFEEPQFAIAPGQFVVLYEGDRVLGGGIIK